MDLWKSWDTISKFWNQRESICLPAACHLAGIHDTPRFIQQNNLAASQSQPKVSFPNNIHWGVLQLNRLDSWVKYGELIYSNDDVVTFTFGVQSVGTWLFIYFYCFGSVLQYIGFDWLNDGFYLRVFPSILGEQWWDSGPVIGLLQCPIIVWLCINKAMSPTLFTQHEEPIKQKMCHLAKHLQTALYETSTLFSSLNARSKHQWQISEWWYLLECWMGSHWRLKEWSWLCKAAFVLLQNVFGYPMIPRFLYWDEFYFMYI